MPRKSKVLLLLALLLLPLPARADDLAPGSGAYALQDGEGRLLTEIACTLSPEDEYISEDNRRYRITAVDTEARRAVAQYVEDVALPEPVLPAASEAWIPRVALYCTHTDESYIPASGTESVAQGGDILDVARELASHLEEEGCEVAVNEANHVPHDAGAYRRSRKTAVALMKEARPTLLVDVHRDGVKAAEYDRTIDGAEVTRVRIVIGRSNQNRAANEEFALRVKAVADKLYPGLVKDIYLGKGSYNQDLMPRSILLEFGTHESEKDRVLESTVLMARVLGSALGAPGGTAEATPAPTASPAANTSTIRRPQSTATPQPTPKVQPQAGIQGPGGGDGGAAWGSIASIVLTVTGIGILCLLVFSRGGKGRAERFFQELTGLGSREDDGKS